MLSFTGSARVGWHLKSKAAGKVVLELGGNAGVIVCKDAQLGWAAQRCVLGGFNYAGQICIKVQRIVVEREVYPAFLEKLVAGARAAPTGDPALAQTVVGPVIDDAAADRIQAWIAEAVAAGAQCAAGGERKGRSAGSGWFMKIASSV